MSRRSLGATAIVLALCSAADAEPSNERLVLMGVALAPADYLLGVSLHEGSHALMAKLVGGHIEQLRIFPPGIDPRTGTFRFGWTYVRGLHSRAAKVAFYLAPKLTDALLLSGFAALALSDAWPNNKYSQLALTVVGTGLWVDFAKDVILFSRHNDVSKAFANLCFTGWRQVPARVAYAALSVGFGLVVARGYQRLFERQQASTTVPIVMPLVSGGF